MLPLVYLRKEEFEIFPDFVTGGLLLTLADIKRGERGGAVKGSCEDIQVGSFKTLVITEIPFGETTGSVIDSIIKASEKGKF